MPHGSGARCRCFVKITRLFTLLLRGTPDAIFHQHAWPLHLFLEPLYEHFLQMRYVLRRLLQLLRGQFRFAVAML